MLTTLVHNAKYLKHAPSKRIDSDSKVEISTNNKESNNSSNSNAKVSDACDNTEPFGHLDQQNEQVITTRSGQVVKSTILYIIEIYIC